MKHYLEKHRKTIVLLFSNTLAAVKMMIFFLLSAFFYKTLNTPEDPLVLKVLEYTIFFGFISLVVFPVFVGGITTLISIINNLYRNKRLTAGDFFLLGSLLYRLVVSLCLFSFLIWMVGMYGDPIFSWALDNQEEGAAAFITLILIVLALQFTPKINNKDNRVFAGEDFNSNEVKTLGWAEYNKNSDGESSSFLSK